MKNKKTYYHLILDRSGSMSSCWRPTTQAFSAQMVKINQLAKDFPEQEFMVSLCVFNEALSFPEWPVKVGAGQLPSIENIQPNGSTALFDAIGESIQRLQSIAGSQIVNDEASVVVVVLTDGEENASIRFTGGKLKSMMDELKSSEKWNFVFIGADFDVAALSNSLNVSASNRRNFSKGDMGVVFDSVEKNLRTYAESKRSGKLGKNFFEDENN
ncbi:MAG: vWA domain-containing protein [Bacteroidota bacterium]|jgi:hypothetical protein